MMTADHTIQRHRERRDKTTAVAATMFALVVAALAVSPWTTSQAHAQACCTATGGGEFGVVGTCHQAVLTAQSSFEPTVGSYDAEGEYRSFGDAGLYDLVTTLGGGTRFGTERFQLYGSVPLRLQYRDLVGSAATGWGIGDAAAGVRYMVARDNMTGIDWGQPDSYVPFVDLYLTGHIPTGTAPDASNDPAGADITGNGHWGVTGGMRATKFLQIRHIVGAYAELNQYLNRNIEQGGETVSQRPGTELGMGLTYMHIPSVQWSWGAYLGLHVAGDTYQADAAVPDSATRRLVGGVHITRHVAYPFWEVTLSATNDAWGDRGGKNLPFVGPSVAVSVQRNFL